MSAYSFVNHRMFVAALGNDISTPHTAGQSDAGPVRTKDRPDTGSIPRARASSPSIPGVLLANAMLNGYQPTAS